jgi:hypothetical protein
MITAKSPAAWSNISMNIKHITVGFAALVLAVSSGVFADEIYKWVDADGNVHYEDRPSGQAKMERLRFSYNRTDSSAVQSRVEDQREKAAARQDARAEREAEKQSAAEALAAAEAKREQCQSYRAKLKTMLESRRLYRENESGERVYLDEASREEARQKAENLIKETCGS